MVKNVFPFKRPLNEAEGVCAWGGCSASCSFKNDLPDGWTYLAYWVCPEHAVALDKLMKPPGRDDGRTFTRGELVVDAIFDTDVVDAIFPTEPENHDPRRENKTLRELLARVRDEFGEQMSPETLDAIAKALQ